MVRSCEIEHILDRACDRVGRAGTQSLAVEPVIFDEAEDRTLIDQGMIDEVLLGPGRYDKQRDTRPVAAAALRVKRTGVDARQCAAAVTARAVARERVGGRAGLVDDWTLLMIVPAVGIVVQDHHRRAVPESALLE